MTTIQRLTCPICKSDYNPTTGRLCGCVVEPSDDLDVAVTRPVSAVAASVVIGLLVAAIGTAVTYSSGSLTLDSAWSILVPSVSIAVLFGVLYKLRLVILARRHKY